MSSQDPTSETREKIRFYFSFRSPYAWLAAEQIEEVFSDLPVSIERIPVFPSPELFPNDPTLVPNKVSHLVHDVLRLAHERGLSVTFPKVLDPDWAPSHAAVHSAEEQGRGHPFVVALFRKRWIEGCDLGQDEVIADAAAKADADPEAVLAAAHSDELRARAYDAWRLGAERDHIFGVPSFAYRGKLYWGQDRMRFVRSAVAEEFAQRD